MPKGRDPERNPAGCKACGCALGDGAGVVPFMTDGERFCPRCFVYVRAPLEPERFRTGNFVPMRCGACGNESVAVGQDHCMQCGSRAIKVLMPLPTVK